jgi:hypothetical protein
MVWSETLIFDYSPLEFQTILHSKVSYVGLLDDSHGRVRKYSFPRRRPASTPPPVTTTPVPVTALLTDDTPGGTPGEIHELESKDRQPTEAETEEESTTTKLPDLANSAVVAIHNLATVLPAVQASPEAFKSTRKFRCKYELLVNKQPHGSERRGWVFNTPASYSEGLCLKTRLH